MSSYSQSPPRGPRPGILHQYTSRLTAFEHTTTPTSSNSSDQNTTPLPPTHTILFLSGLGDGLLHPTYPSKLSTHLPTNWSIAEVLLSSSYTGWTTSSLSQDANELSKATTYFRTLPGRNTSDSKIVLLGHYTGAQVIMEYLTGPWKEPSIPIQTQQRPKVDGVILQAGISDREGVLDALSLEDVEESLRVADEMTSAGKGEDIMPNSVTKGVFGQSPCARRWKSLVAKEGDDDYFSSYLSDDVFLRTFGSLGNRGVGVCVLLSGDDEHMPSHVDKEELLGRWKRAVVQGCKGQEECCWDGENSAVVKGASHNYAKSGEESLKELFSRIIGFIGKIERQGLGFGFDREEYGAQAGGGGKL